jgi:hypothetical protein
MVARYVSMTGDVHALAGAEIPTVRLWVSGPLPGAVHDLTARIQGIVRELATAGLVVLADKGYADVGARPDPR